MEQKKRVIALGFFDGVHNGHGALMRRTAQVAQELGAIPGLEKLAQTLHQQSRVLHSLKTEIAARVQQVMPATSQRLN